jgi:hypothetical protein
MAKKIIGNVNLSDLYFKQLPEILKDVSIDGDFFCSNNQLTSLVGAPKTVGGEFDCSYNNLTSLIGAPSNVGGNFYCDNNKLTSLVGAPKTVGGDFYCGFNTVKFTEAQVRALCDVKGNVHI